MPNEINRREMLSRSLTVAGVAVAQLPVAFSSNEPQTEPDKKETAQTTPVAIQRCNSYDPLTFRQALDAAFDSIGLIGDLVRGKTVTIKINLTGMTWEPVGGLPARETYQTHPNSLAALCAALVDGGAKEIVVVETLYWRDSFENILAESGWDVKAVQSAGNHRVRFEDIRNQGAWPSYARVDVPWGGFMYPAFDLNQRFEKTDVLISLAKLKQHACAGVTGAVKNFFGNTPCSLYGNDSPSEDALQHRTLILHSGEKNVVGGVPAELDHGLSNSPFVRVPRIVADIYGARPADLCIVEGVRSIRGGEGHWNKGVSVNDPKLLIVGRNGVCTDAVSTAAMGFDPKAGHGETPFPGDNHLELLASVGVGTNDLDLIEVVGLPLKEAVYPFEPASGTV
jgi:uncharacterized protein (DUF362 family)